YCCQETVCDGRTFLLDYSYAGHSAEIKQQIVDMAMNASGIRDTARVLHVSPTPCAIMAACAMRTSRILGAGPCNFSHSTRFLRNNRLRVDTPLPLRLCLCFGTQGHPMPDEAERRRLLDDYAARSTVTV